MIILKTKEEIEKMARAAQIAAGALKILKEMARPGVSTLEMDQKAEEVILKNGGTPSFKGYRGYQFSTCLSRNEEVVHGLPDAKKILVEGDLLSIDVGVKLEGFHGDVAETIAIGRVSEEALDLMKAGQKALNEAIKFCRAGERLGRVSHTIEEVASKNGFRVVRDYYGHGIGRELHEDPLVPNFGDPQDGPVLKNGLTLAIETMLNEGGHRVKTLSDGWTVVTLDGKLSTHFEHTLAIVDGRPEVLTKQ